MNPVNPAAMRLLPIAGLLALALSFPEVAAAQAGPDEPAGATLPAKDLPLSAAERQQFVGTYQVNLPSSPGRTMTFRVYEEEGTLYGQPQGAQPKRLVYEGGNRFYPEHEPRSVVVFTLEEGRAVRFSVMTPEGPLEGVREAESPR